MAETADVKATLNPNVASVDRARLWQLADGLRGHIDSAEYKHVVLGLIFLKYISDSFDLRRAELISEGFEDAVDDKDEYVAEGVFWVPTAARWAVVQASAKQPQIGKIIDE